ncbi:MAG TPA: ATP synthase F0 subunit B [Ilumatobacteraceae bacterium]|nr:ATP synthase F0 subunit B [Ilumatobacteraceae bacterium]
MLTVTVTTTGAGHVVVVHLPQSTAVAETTAEDKGPSPIAPEVKELVWGAGSFILLFVLMRLFIFPKLRQGMDARYGKIRGDHDTADATRAGAKAEVAEYEAALATVKAEARERIDAARQTLESERSAALDEANARIATRRAEGTARTEAARAAAAPHIHEAVADVSSRAAELATGRRPDADTVTSIVASLMAGGGA